MGFEATAMAQDNPIPTSWSVVKVEEVADTNKSNISVNNAPQWIEYIDISSVGERRIDPPIPMKFNLAPSRAKRRVFPGDILISTVRPNLKHFIYLKKAKDNWVASTGFAVVSAKPKVDSCYLYYYLTSEIFTQYLTRVADGGAYPAFNSSEIKNAELLLPPLEEQKAIAHILGTIDDKIELNQQMNRNLEAIAQAMFKSWFIDFDPVLAKVEGRQPAGMDAATAALFPDSFEDSPLGEIPKGWRVIKLADICSTQYGYTASAKNDKVGTHLLRVMDINKQNWIEWANVPFCEISEADLAKYSLKVGDIVVARMADPGKAAIVEQAVNAVFASYLVRLKTESLSLSYYVYNFLKSSLYKAYTAGAQSGSVQANMNAKVITAVDLILPQNKLLRVFLDRILPIRKQIITNVEQSCTLATIRDTLLPKLMSGEIRVKEAEEILEDVA